MIALNKALTDDRPVAAITCLGLRERSSHVLQGDEDREANITTQSLRARLAAT